MPVKSNRHKFTERIRKPLDSGNAKSWGFLLLPKSVSSSLARRGRLTAHVELNGVMSQVTLEPDGRLSHWLRIDAALMKEAGVAFGDEVEVDLKPLEQEPTPRPPADLAKMLQANPKALATWNSTTAIAQVDWIAWIESSKQASTRAKRIADASDMLAKAKKRVCCFDPSGFYSRALAAPEEAPDEGNAAVAQKFI